MSTAHSLVAAFACLLAIGPALGYDEQSYSTSADLIFARVDEPTTISFASPTEAAKLMSSCKSGRTMFVESGPLACRCGAEPAAQGRGEELVVTLRCPTRKGSPTRGSLVLATASTVGFDERRLDDIPELGDSDARPILRFLKSVDQDLRKHGKGRNLPVYPLLVGDQQYWAVHTDTESSEAADCERRKFQVVWKQGDRFELVGSTYDLESILMTRPERRTLLRSSNRCDGVQADLHDLGPKIRLRTSFSGH